MVCVIKVPLVHWTVHKWWYRWRKKMATAGFGRPRQGLVCPFDDVRIIHFISSNRRQLNCSLCCFLHFTLYFSLSIKSTVNLPLHLIPHQQHTRGGRGNAWVYLRSVESTTKAIKHNGKFNWLPKKILTRAQISLNGSWGGTKTERFTSQLNLFVFLSSNHNSLISIFPFLFCPSPPLVRAEEQSRQRRRQGLSTPKIKFCNHYLTDLIKFVWKTFHK